MSDGHRSPWQLYLLIVFMVTCWAMNFIVAKIVLREIPPMLIVGLRTALAGFAIIPVYLIYTRRNGVPGWERRDLPLLFMLGVAGVALNQVFFVLGINRTSVSHAAIIIGLTPVLVLLMAAASGQEQLKPARLAGMFLALAGVIVLQMNSFSGFSDTLTGDLYIFLAGVVFAGFTVRGKAEVHRLGGVTVNTFAYVGSGIALLPLTLWLGSDFDFTKVTWGAWLSLAYMAFIPSVICYLIYYYALARIPASRLAAFAYLQPLLAMLVAIPVLGEHPSESLLAGGAIVLAGVFVAERI